MDARDKRGHDGREFLLHKLRCRHSFSIRLLSRGERCRAAHPGGLSCQIVGFEPFAVPSEGSGAPKFAGAERRTRWPALRRARPSSGRELPAHNADRRASRRSTAAFFLRPRDRLLETEGAAIAKLP